MLQKTPKPDPVDSVGTSADIADIIASGKAPRKRSRMLVAAAVVALAALGAWWLLGGSSSSEVTYVTAPVARGDLTVEVTATGTVQPTNQVEISSELSGTIDTVEANFNDVVERGQTLATLTTDKLNAAVALSEATLAAREADVRQAQATVDETAASYARSQQLRGKGLSSQELAEGAEAAHKRAEAALASANANRDIARANLSIARSDLDKAAIVSPINGVVLSRTAEVGQTVASSLQAPVLFTLAEDLAKMELQVDIDEADVGKVGEGDTARFTVEAFPGRTFPAAIAQVRYSPATVEGVVTYKAILTVDNGDLLLRPGMTATAEITVEQVSDALLVPNAALRYAPPAPVQARERSGGLIGLIMPGRPGGRRVRTTVTPSAAERTERTVWVLRAGAPVAVQVQTGATDGSRTAVVSDDLQEGDRLITASRVATQ
jgi:HlyD family secretion protein